MATNTNLTKRSIIKAATLLAQIDLKLMAEGSPNISITSTFLKTFLYQEHLSTYRFIEIYTKLNLDSTIIDIDSVMVDINSRYEERIQWPMKPTLKNPAKSIHFTHMDDAHYARAQNKVNAKVTKAFEVLTIARDKSSSKITYAEKQLFYWTYWQQLLLEGGTLVAGYNRDKLGEVISEERKSNTKLDAFITILEQENIHYETRTQDK